MSDFFNSEIVQWVLATLIGMLILGILGWLQFKRDEKIVAEFLKRSGIETSRSSRTTRAISSATNLSQKRLRKICSKSPRIKNNQKDNESWKLS